MSSPFLFTTPTTSQNTLAILHLRRDLLTPTTLSLHDDLNLGYAEGKVTTTRFGSFPHSTLMGKPWGSQVKASKVDTGTRGRVGEGIGSKARKRKRDEDVVVEPEGATPQPTALSQYDGENDHGAIATLKETNTSDSTEKVYKTAEPAETGFCHLLAPTPELWTASLPHRTQVVYTPDYSYILQHLRVLPGSIVIEAGAGSGSFTHAAARAVFSGQPDASSMSTERKGKIYSFEFHLPRYETLKSEILAHGLSETVHLSHRDVCQDGFLLDDDHMAEPINASHIFLDLPAPWLALRYLTRKAPVQRGSTSSSPLNPETAVHIATFSPCIEQVTRTVSALRGLGWLDIQTVELQARHIEVRRERVGLTEEPSTRGSVPVASTVSEAVTRLRDLEARERDFRATQLNLAQDQPASPRKGDISAAQGNSSSNNNNNYKNGRSLFDQGRLITRSEPELRTHTSYLTFAILPREWSVEDEEAARIKISALAAEEAKGGIKISKRQVKKAAKKVRLEAEGKGEWVEVGEVDKRTSEETTYMRL
ncbi:MAG: hypothetical protein LQ342_000003 [Letrouitia transgressa]|nr:MAG: hypothetical protein LQ342_000003 [Letrouitia transgressa]